MLSPYRREHINRLGDYLLDLQRLVPPLDPTIYFAFKSAASAEMWRIFCESRPDLFIHRLVNDRDLFLIDNTITALDALSLKDTSPS
ncbi:hypothetical protein [Burkholderia cenocepacia]|uniref:hypothetical protein n=1 Tax=Burkholderia cenocepacia TaxID=95486 RepID=UPI002AB74C63|nr:hypothetical protein [Burkholderia cenocepacia]